MLTRCTNPKATAYARYGGAGIGVCEAWHSFEAFLEDMGPRPDGTSLDRINGEEGYSKGNCRWATTKTQNCNTRANVFLTALGRTQTVSEWAEQLGMKYITLYRRVYHSGWSHHDAVTTPVKP